VETPLVALVSVIRNPAKQTLAAQLCSHAFGFCQGIELMSVADFVFFGGKIDVEFHVASPLIARKGDFFPYNTYRKDARKTLIYSAES